MRTSAIQIMFELIQMLDDIAQNIVSVAFSIAVASVALSCEVS